MVGIVAFSLNGLNICITLYHQIDSIHSCPLVFKIPVPITEKLWWVQIVINSSKRYLGIVVLKLLIRSNNKEFYSSKSNSSIFLEISLNKYWEIPYYFYCKKKIQYYYTLFLCDKCIHVLVCNKNITVNFCKKKSVGFIIIIIFVKVNLV